MRQTDKQKEPKAPKYDRRLSLAPLTVEEALRAVIAAGPHPTDTNGKPIHRKRDLAAAQTEKPAPTKERRRRGKSQEPTASA